MLNNVLIFLMPVILAYSFIEKRHSQEYSFNNPAEIITLPENLHEVSGLTVLDSVNVGCIQDENGILYIYNMSSRKIITELPFHYDGDYEDIARVENKLYVLRSDGTLYEIDKYQSGNPDVKTHSTGIPANDNEGLCYDKKNNRLLIAVKEKPDMVSENKDLRLIYAFDLKTKSAVTEPAYRYSLKTIKAFMARNQIAANNKQNKSKEGKKTQNNDLGTKEIKFASSAIGIHPLSQKLYLLSANDKMLFIFNLKGEIENAVALNPEIYNKAEGLAFFENGDIIISNEGQDKKPTLVYLKYKK